MKKKVTCKDFPGLPKRMGIALTIPVLVFLLAGIIGLTPSVNAQPGDKSK